MKIAREIIDSERDGFHRLVEPRDAATLIVIDRSSAEPKVLLGRRHTRHAFMPGKFVFPGFIDPHVHIYLPFMGTYAKDTYATASRAALVGGTTTLIEMCCPARGDDPLEAYRRGPVRRVSVGADTGAAGPGGGLVSAVARATNRG